MALKSPAQAKSEDPAFRVKALIAITQELTEIFTQENACLRERNPAAIAPFQSDKARLAAAYATSIRQIASDRTSVEPAGEILLEQLRDLTRTFEKRAAEQRALLKGAQQAGESVLKAIADEVASMDKSPSYGATEAPARTPIALNERA